MLSIYCVSHKKVNLYSSGVKVVGVAGLSGEESDFSDSEGENISRLNDRFSELTGHYYIWKNYVPDSVESRVGFCHYRRFLLPPSAIDWIVDNCSKPFDNRSRGGDGNYSSGYLIEQEQLRIMFQTCDYLQDLNSIARDVDIVLPKRNNLPNSGFKGQYKRCHPIEPFDLMIDVIRRKNIGMARAACDYFNDFTYAYWNNLFIIRYDLFARYCEFAFDVLLQVNTELKYLNGIYQNRACAFLSERLLNFWIYYNNLEKREVDWCVTSEIQLPLESHQVAIKI